MPEHDDLIKNLMAGAPGAADEERTRLWDDISTKLPEGVRGQLAVKLTKSLPTSKRKAALAEGAKDLSKKERREAFQQSATLAQPGRAINDKLWLIVISSFCAVFVGSFITLAIAVFLEKSDYQVLLTVFTSIVGFLAGLFAPSPVARNSGENGETQERGEPTS